MNIILYYQGGYCRMDIMFFEYTKKSVAEVTTKAASKRQILIKLGN